MTKGAPQVDLPFTGEIVVEESQAAVRSIELQLVRAETVKNEKGEATKELTEIQNLQIADGDVARGPEPESKCICCKAVALTPRGGREASATPRGGREKRDARSTSSTSEPAGAASSSPSTCSSRACSRARPCRRTTTGSSSR